MDVLFEALYYLSIQQHYDSKANNIKSNCKLRIPLACLIDYKGFRCIAIAKIPIVAKNSPNLGFHQGMYINKLAESNEDYEL